MELNGLKPKFDNLIDYFMENVIDYGYITLFACAFPIGAPIAFLVNLMELRMKIYSFLFVYQRPKSERGVGID